MEKQVQYTIREVFAGSGPREREKTLRNLMGEYLDLLKKEICEAESFEKTEHVAAGRLQRKER